MNVLTTACFSKVTKVMVTALKFFLGSDTDEVSDGHCSDIVGIVFSVNDLLDLNIFASNIFKPSQGNSSLKIIAQSFQPCLTGRLAYGMLGKFTIFFR